ncbi:hypothetical protein [Nitrosomonas sp. Nm34]|uniref:hypothetical protein n=1 Tax=Nitrosomonas sp. Nm34 TaxID=1881055 RepID=UPI001587BD8D|nr:hypothetical protein [Nitrosomonas sp. Nm34]
MRHIRRNARWLLRPTRAESFSTLPGEISRMRLGRISRSRIGEEALETRWNKGLKNQETGHFKHFCGLARSILAWVSVATAATTRPAST